ncbi:MAG: hypothetical protein ABIK83_13735 [Candidatus Zixiibacteriota bacterium]
MQGSRPEIVVRLIRVISSFVSRQQHRTYIAGRDIISKGRLTINAMRSHPLVFSVRALIVLDILIGVMVVQTLVFHREPQISFLIDEEKVWQPPSEPEIGHKRLVNYRQTIASRRLFQAVDNQVTGGDDPVMVIQADEIVSSLTLVGIISGMEPVAMITSGSNVSPVYYRIGDSVKGLKITNIDIKSVILTDGENEYHLKP